MKKINIRKTNIRMVSVISIILISSFLLTFLLSYFNENNDKPDYRKMKVIANEALGCIEGNFKNLTSNGENTELNNILNKYKLKVMVLDLEGNQLYNYDGTSTVHEEFTKDSKEKVNIKYVEIEDELFYNYVAPVIINEKTAGSCVFSFPKNLLRNKSNTSKYFIPLALGLVISILLLVKVLKFTSSFVLSPIKELKILTENITKGKFRTKLKYEIDSDVTSLCTGIELMQEELLYSMDRQRSMERERKELMACISHDLKTPLATIKAYVGAINDGYAKDEQTLKKYVKVIDEKADNILMLINDFLEHSKAELGELKINKTPTYSRKLFQEAYEGYKMEFKKKEVILTVSETIPDILINVDALRIEQVLYNLLQNALKYTQTGGRVHFQVENYKDFIKVSVSDNGIGISSMDLHYIFHKFYRGEKEFSRDHQEGAGLGLYICKYIVEAHGGEIHAMSRPMEGSTFFFTIPKL